MSNFFIIGKKRLLILPFCMLILGSALCQEICTDGIDNDGDSAADCADTDCSGFPYPNANTFTTGQGTINGPDPNWDVSSILYSGAVRQTASTLPLPNASGVTYSSALISQNCAPGVWVTPSSLPAPLNSSNWITSAIPCVSEVPKYVYRYYRRAFRLPCSCSGSNIYPLNNLVYRLDGYGDNRILAIFINGVNINAPNLPSGNGTFQGGNQIVLTFPGPWNAGDNTIEILLENGAPASTSAGVQGLLLTGSQSGASLFPTPIAAFTSNSVSCATSYASGQNISFSSTSTAGSGTITSYLWTFSPSATPTSATTQNTSAYFTGTNGTALLRVTDNNGCTATASCNFNLTAPTNCNAAFSVNNVSQCLNSNSFVLTSSSNASTNGTISSYSWNFGLDASPSTANTAGPHTISYSSIGTKTISLTITDSNGCTSTAQTTVTVNPAMTVSAVATPTAICNGQASATLTTTPSGGTGFTYAWSNAAGSTQSVVVSPNASTTYSVTVTNSNGCTATANAPVTVNAVPTVSITGTTAICSGTSTTLTANATAGSGTITNYAWSNGQSGAAQTTISVNTAGTYVVTVTNSNGCTATANRTVTVNANPTVNVTGTTAICSGTSTTLTANATAGSGTITNYAWSNSQSGASQTTISVSTAGTYVVTVTNSNGCTATANRTVTVNANPTVNVTGTNTICSGASTTLTANATAGSGTITNYAWSNGQSGAAQTTISVNTAGTYVVTVTNSNGCTATANRTLTVNTIPTAGINLAETSGVANNDGIICAGSSVQLTGTGGATYTWSGAAIGTPSANPQNILPTATGTYTVTVASAAGCTATASRLITVNPLPVAAIVPGGGGSVCNTQSGLTITASGGTTYLWSTGATTAAINIASSQPTTTYTVTITNSNNCSATTNVIVNAVGTGGCNQIPIAINDINNTLINTPVSGQVLTNDSDPDAGQTLTVNTTPSGVSGGTVVLNNNGTYTFTPTTGFIGVGQFTYTVCDNGTPQACDQATVYINVIANTIVNNPPAPGNDVIQTLINTTVTGTVATNDIDPDGNINPTGFTLVTPPSATAGVLTLSSNGNYTFVPTTGFTGTATFTYQVCDLGIPVLCANATGIIEVYPNPNGSGNDAPNAQDDAFSGTGTNPITGNVLPNDSDPNGNTLTVNTTPVVNVPPSAGTLVLNSNGSFTFTPASGFTGTTSFVYQVCDNGSPSLCDNATVYIRVFNCTLTAGSCVPQNDECQLNQGQVRIQAQGGKLPYSVTWTPVHGTPAQPAQITTEGGTLLINGLHGNTTYLFTVTDADGCRVP